MSVLAACFIAGCGRGAPKFESDAWQTRSFSDMTIEAPFEFGPGPEMSSALQPEVRALLDDFDVRMGGSEELFMVGVSRITCNASIEPSLEAAFDGGIRQAAMQLGDPSPVFRSSPTKVNGLEARRGGYRNFIKGVEWRIDALVVLSGKRLWQVHVAYSFAESARDAKRMLDSVHVKSVR